MASVRFVILAGFLSACGGSAELPHDAATDVYRTDADRDAEFSTAVDAAIDPGPDASCHGVEDGCPCPTDDVVMCNGGSGHQCCAGTWRYFLDGPCWMRADAGTGGPPDCSGGGSVAGCPCDTEGEMQCGYFYEWSRVCRDGTWVTLVGHMCC